MVDRNRLGLVVEDVLEPELEIVDAHHHLWDAETSHYGRYELDDLRYDTESGHNVTTTVFIDCRTNYRTEGPEQFRPVGETEYVAARAAASEQTPGAVIGAIVSHADLRLGSSVAEVLEAHIEAGGGRFRGIRHIGAHDPDIPLSYRGPEPGLYLMPAVREGAQALADLGMSFDAWVYHHQLGELLELGRAVPELPVVINHLGGPLGIGPYTDRRPEVLAELRSNLSALAELPRTSLKLGGVGMPRFGTADTESALPPTSDAIVADWGELIRWAIDRFGPDRCMFESNYPVDGQTTGYGVLWNAFKKMTVDYTPAERAQLFSGTARRVYRL